MTPCVRHAYRAGELAITKIKRRALDCTTSFVDNERESSALKKERQSVALGVLINAALAPGLTLSLAYFLHERRKARHRGLLQMTAPSMERHPLQTELLSWQSRGRESDAAAFRRTATV